MQYIREANSSASDDITRDKIGTRAAKYRLVIDVDSRNILRCLPAQAVAINILRRRNMSNDQKRLTYFYIVRYCVFDTDCRVAIGQ